MQNINKLTTEDLKLMIKESIQETLSEMNLKDIFREVIEDISLERAIEEGLDTEVIDSAEFMNEIKDKIN